MAKTRTLKITGLQRNGDPLGVAENGKKPFECIACIDTLQIIAKAYPGGCILDFENGRIRPVVRGKGSEK